MDLARALSRTFAISSAGCYAIQRRSNPARTMAGTRSPADCVCQPANPIRPRSGDGVQDAQVRRLSESTVAIDAARSEPWHLSPWPGDNDVATTGSATDPDRPDAFLPRARSGHR